MPKLKKPMPLPGRAIDDDARMTVAFEVVAYVTGTQAQLARLHERAARGLETVYGFAVNEGCQIVQASGEMRALRAGEAVAVIPRKKHMEGVDGRQICATPHVSAKHLVDDPELVTCKLCLVKIAEEEG